MKNHVELASQAQRDLRRMGRGSDRDLVAKALFEELTAVPVPENLDVKPLKGTRPWMRLRVGDWRVLYRPLDRDELQHVRGSQQQEDSPQGFLVARVVNRDLDEVVRNLAR